MMDFVFVGLVFFFGDCFLGFYCFVFKSIRRGIYVSNLLDRWDYFIGVVCLPFNSFA